MRFDVSTGSPDAKDQDWLLEVGNRQWVVLTKDKRFQNRVLELTAIVRSKARVFKLTAGKWHLGR